MQVSDFGLSRVLKDKNHIKTQTFGTVTHMPPELLAKGTLSPSSDVYAVGVLMWEIFTGEKVRGCCFLCFLLLGSKIACCMQSFSCLLLSWWSDGASVSVVAVRE